MNTNGQDFIKEMAKLPEKVTLQLINSIWNGLLDFLSKNWKPLMTIFFLILFIATLKAMIGRWGSLGSILYNTFYFGTLLILGLIFGPQIFLDDVFKMACTIILYPVCYWLVGLILDKVRGF